MRCAIFMFGMSVLVLFGCGTSIEERGGEGQPCFGDGTCDGELFCTAVNICRRPEEDCGERVCGSSPNVGYDCGSCSGSKEYCSAAGQCVDDCAGFECGTSPNEGYDCGTCSTGLCISGSCEDILLSITGGTFMMGSNTGNNEEQPVHQVTVPSFEIMRTEVTVELYNQCVDSGACTAPDSGTNCNWNENGRDDHPINCVDWQQSVEFCQWAGGRLPSEAEWEYAARSGGQDIEYPWGDQTATCQYAVMYEGEPGCGQNNTWPVCSKTAGNTAQGLCDMAGNVWEWVQDLWHQNYNGAPSDGSAWESPIGSLRVIRGGGFYASDSGMRVANRYKYDSDLRYDFIGIRCARDIP